MPFLSPGKEGQCSDVWIVLNSPTPLTCQWESPAPLQVGSLPPSVLFEQETLLLTQKINAVSNGMWEITCKQYSYFRNYFSPMFSSHFPLFRLQRNELRRGTKLIRWAAGETTTHNKNICSEDLFTEVLILE